MYSVSIGYISQSLTGELPVTVSIIERMEEPLMSSTQVVDIYRRNGLVLAQMGCFSL